MNFVPFSNQSCYKLNRPKLYRIDKDSNKAYSFSTKIFSLFFFLKTNLNTFVAVSKDHGNTISDKFPCNYLKVTKDCKSAMFDQHSLEFFKYHILLHKSSPPNKPPPFRPKCQIRPIPSNMCPSHSPPHFLN